MIGNAKFLPEDWRLERQVVCSLGIDILRAASRHTRLTWSCRSVVPRQLLYIVYIIEMTARCNHTYLCLSRFAMIAPIGLTFCALCCQMFCRPDFGIFLMTAPSDKITPLRFTTPAKKRNYASQN